MECTTSRSACARWVAAFQLSGGAAEKGGEDLQTYGVDGVPTAGDCMHDGLLERFFTGGFREVLHLSFNCIVYPAVLPVRTRFRRLYPPK